MATRPRRRTTARAFDRATYESHISVFVGSLSEERYRNLAGLIDASDQADVYEAHAHLFELRAVEALRAAFEAGGDEQERNRSLLAFATDGYLARHVARLTDAIITAESRAVIGWRGEMIPYRAARNRIGTMGERSERNGLFQSWLLAVDAINPLRAERLDLLHEAVAGLGYADYVDMVHVTRGWSPDLVSVMVRSALNDSETGYFAAMRRTLARIEIEHGDGSLADAWYALRGLGWNAWFEPRRLVRVPEATLFEVGIEVGTQSGVTWDLEPRPNKSPRAFCAPVHVPGDVRLLVNPQGGWEDLAAVLHESGHLARLFGVPDGAPPGAALLGDESVTEGYGYLLEGLLGEPEWLADRLDMTAADAVPFVDFYALVTMSRLRRLGGQLIYELGLHRGGEHAVHRAMYSGTLGLLAGVQWPAELYLTTGDDGLRSAACLRGVMLAGVLEDHLGSEHPEGWWRTSDASATLSGLLARGGAWNAERVVAHLGYDDLDWRPVLRKIRTQLIGEMSGYGGPNITTRAGTRKI